ncbi:MAG TPA: hypothetical protein VF601_05020 [Beijerinckiaceae bacterium]|jgi:hypothetical protein
MSGWRLLPAVAALLWLSIPELGAAHEGHDHGAEEARGHEVETENLFGFTAGSDTGEAGSRELSHETIAAVGKRVGSYRGIGQKLELGVGATDNLSISFSLLGDYHRIRNVPGFDDIGGRYAFNGFGSEVRWRFLDRKTAPFGLTLQLEPSVSRIDEASGQSGRKLGSENKLIFDRELVPNTLFAAVNILYDVDRMKERRSLFVTERSANAGVGAALSWRVVDDLFLGAEARYLRAYEGFGLEKLQGQALYAGPTLYARVLSKGWISAAWNVQVAGREAVDRAGRANAVAEYNEGVEAAVAAGDPLPPFPDLGRRGRLDLRNFERHQIKLKAGFEF